MSLTTVTINGKILTPAGTAVAGTIFVTLSDGDRPVAGTSDDGGTAQKLAAPEVVTIAGDGSFTLALVPNDEIDPSGTVYEFVYELEDSAGRHYRYHELLDLSGLSGSVDIGDISTTVATSSAVVVTALTNGSLIVNGSDIDTALPARKGLLGVVAMLDPGSGETAAYRCHRTASGIYRWIWELGANIASTSVSSLPAATSADLFRTIFYDAGAETAAYTCHRDSAGTYDWALASNGGA